MNDDERKVIIYKVSEYRQTGSDESQRAPLSPVNRWLSYAIMIPVVVVLVLIGVFFFAAFFALAAVLVAVLAVRFWWLRRKMEHDMHQSADMTQKAEAGQTVIIEDAQIIEETETRETGHKSR